MGLIVVRSWIPRSFVHVQEVFKNVNEGKLGVPVSNLVIDGSVCFVIDSFEEFNGISFSLDGDGVYSMGIELPDSVVVESSKSFLEACKRLLLEVVIKACHVVTYDQIKSNVLPLNFQVAVYSKAPISWPEGYDAIDSGLVRIYRRKSDEYIKDSFLIVSGTDSIKVDSAVSYYSFCVLASHFLYDMMDKMAEHYKNSEGIVELLRVEDVTLADLKEAILGLDLLEKDVTEGKAKISQLIHSLGRKESGFKRFTIAGSSKPVLIGLEVPKFFFRLGADKDYLLSLWDLLLGYLMKIDTAVEARMSWQESLESRRVEAFMSVQSASVISALVVGIIFFTTTTLFQNWLLLIVFAVVWIAFYQLIITQVGKRRRASK